MNKEKMLGYTPEDLHSVQAIVPRFPCPHCGAKNWSKVGTNLHTSPTRLWRAMTPCVSCTKQTRWLIDPDLTIELQTEEMHRPIGF
jgi:hypothetical protein